MIKVTRKNNPTYVTPDGREYSSVGVAVEAYKTRKAVEATTGLIVGLNDNQTEELIELNWRTLLAKLQEIAEEDDTVEENF